MTHLHSINCLITLFILSKLFIVDYRGVAIDVMKRPETWLLKKHQMIPITLRHLFIPIIKALKSSTEYQILDQLQWTVIATYRRSFNQI